MKWVEVAINGPCCSGCMACVELAPEVFNFDEAADIAVVIKTPCPADIAHKVAAYCPDDCIDIIE
ncbi:MAG: ferredoxin [Desulfomicrobium sp.]|nr:ferredoxin [Desulfomicrobium sp.]